MMMAAGKPELAAYLVTQAMNSRLPCNELTATSDRSRED
jgi:hypothetical protein